MIGYINTAININKFSFLDRNPIGIRHLWNVEVGWGLVLEKERNEPRNP
jgi:hypothetical protein